MYPVNKMTVPTGHYPASAKLAKNSKNQDRHAVAAHSGTLGGFGREKKGGGAVELHSSAAPQAK